MAAGMKEYIIQYTAKSKGTKIVTKEFKGIDKTINKTTGAVSKQQKQVKGLGDKWASLATRAALVVPVWMLIRNVYMSVMRTITDSLKAYRELEDQLARIKTVTQGTGETVNTQMEIIKKSILSVAIDSRIALKDLGEGFYFLKTANLSASEAMAAFKPAVSLATGTMNSMAESARAVAGIYNTMGKYLGDNLTTTQKFQKISDMLAFTYSTQDVQLSELIESYTKLAPYVTGITDDFTSLVSMLGFVNTRLLRGGRAGRLLGRAILQLTKNSKQLKAEFGITFDPKKPINFLGIIGQIRKAMNITGKLTAEQGEKLREVFATRGGVPVRIFIEHFEKLSDTIKLAGENVDGFAKRMEKIRMGTLSAQGARFKNIMADLAETFITTAYGTSAVADSLKLMNESLINSKSLVKGTAQFFNDLGIGIEYTATKIRQFHEMLWGTPSGRISNMKESLDYFKELNKMTSFEQSLQGRLGKQFKAEADIAVIKEIEEEQRKLYKAIRIESEKGEKADKKRIDALLKENDKLEAQKKLLWSEEKQYQEWQTNQNDLEKDATAEALMNEKEHLRLMEHQAKIMKLQGATALEIHRFKLTQIEELIDGEAKTLAITKEKEAHEIRLAQLQKDKTELIKKESENYSSLLVKMAKGTEEERERIKLFLKIKEYSPERLGRLYEEAVGKGSRKMRIEGAGTGRAYGPGVYTGEAIRKLMLDFYKDFSTAGKGAITGGISREMGVRPSLAPTKDLWNITPKTTIQAININLPHDIYKVTAENVGKLVTEEMLKNPIWNKLVVDQINRITEKDVK